MGKTEFTIENNEALKKLNEMMGKEMALASRGRAYLNKTLTGVFAELEGAKSTEENVKIQALQEPAIEFIDAFSQKDTKKMQEMAEKLTRLYKKTEAFKEGNAKNHTSAHPEDRQEVGGVKSMGVQYRGQKGNRR